MCRFFYKRYVPQKNKYVKNAWDIFYFLNIYIIYIFIFFIFFFLLNKNITTNIVVISQISNISDTPFPPTLSKYRGITTIVVVILQISNISENTLLTMQPKYIQITTINVASSGMKHKRCPFKAGHHFYFVYNGATTAQTYNQLYVLVHCR